MLELHDISFSIGKKKILHDISTKFEPGKLSMIIGPNGSGKTTMVRIMSGEFQASSGTVHNDHTPYQPGQRQAMARVRGVLSQHSDLSFPLAVEDVVMMGRYPHFSLQPSHRDFEICRSALERLGIDNLSERNYLSLSGGERQMVQFARILAQLHEKQPGRSRFLFLDEPIASLDIRHQHLFMDIAKSFAAEGDIVVAVLHDLHLVAQYADFIVALKDGTKVFEGKAGEVIQPSRLSRLYEIRSEIVETTAGNMPVFFYK